MLKIVLFIFSRILQAPSDELWNANSKQQETHRDEFSVQEVTVRNTMQFLQHIDILIRVLIKLQAVKFYTGVKVVAAKNPVIMSHLMYIY